MTTISTAIDSFSSELYRGYSTLRYSENLSTFLVEELPQDVGIFLGASKTAQTTLNNIDDAELLLPQITQTHNLVSTTGMAQHFSWHKTSATNHATVSGTAFRLTDDSVGLIFEKVQNLVQMQHQATFVEWEKTVNSIDDIEKCEQSDRYWLE